MTSPPPRNSACPCGSGKKLKHCCENLIQSSPAFRGITPEEAPLLPYILAADEEGFKAGETPYQRAFKNIMRTMDKIHPGMKYIIAGNHVPREVGLINSITNKLYRPDDIGVGGLHMGVIMFRDVFLKLSVPISYGAVSLNPLDMLDLSETQLDWLASRPADMSLVIDQFIDLVDFGHGMTELGQHRAIGDDCRTFLGLAHFQLQAAAATLTGAYDRRGAVQSALLAAELALKGGLAANGITTAILKDQYGHHLKKLTETLAGFEAGLDRERILAVIDKYPQYVPNRCNVEQPMRVEVGHIAMGAQFIAADVMRQLTQRDLRKSSDKGLARTYPPAGK
jgi:hypothetical protein